MKHTLIIREFTQFTSSINFLSDTQAAKNFCVKEIAQQVGRGFIAQKEWYKGHNSVFFIDRETGEIVEILYCDL